ncbi:autotransporter outer membrane beta-barrel domain-containing protein [Tardiphaga sp. 619_E2_N8_5]|uniref:autotransporter outer membrane beta-barrel domain-containing protein n=1 Tax=unclassified Tardiphaga TaxID=2631404 RepID=UPI003F26F9EC
MTNVRKEESHTGAISQLLTTIAALLHRYFPMQRMMLGPGRSSVRVSGYSASSVLATGLIASLAGEGSAQTVCTTGNTPCTVTGTINVAAGATGLSDTGPNVMSTAAAVLVNLNGANTTALLAAQGGTINFDNGTVSSTVAASNRTGLRVTDANSAINASNAAISLTLASGTGNGVSNLIGVNVDNGGAAALNSTTVNVSGLSNGTGIVGMRVAGSGSQLVFNGGSVTAAGRGAIGVLAEAGGVAIIGTGATIAASGAATLSAPVTRSHALFSTGAGSQINGTGINANSAGIGGNAARAEAGGAVSLISSTLSTTGAGSELFPSAAAFASSGGTISLGGPGSTIVTTGQAGYGLHVEDAGSQAIVSNTNVTVSGSRAVGINLLNGGAATVGNSAISANNFIAIDLLGTGSALALNNTSVNTISGTAYGIRARSGSEVVINGGSITTQGASAAGLFIGSSTVTANGLNIRIYGDNNAMGALADGGSRVELNGGQVTTSGNGVAVAAFPHAVASRNPGGQLIANGTPLTTLGNRAMGAVADDGGTTTLNGNPITTFGTQSLGLFAVVEQTGPQFAASVVGNNLTIETAGALAHGAQAQQNDLAAQALITLNDSSLTTHGAGAMGLRAILSGTVIANRTMALTEGLAAHGVEARDNNSSVTLNNSLITATGPNAHGALANSGGLVVGNATMVRAMGANGSALHLAGAPGFVSNANFNGSTLTNVSGPTIGVAGDGNVTLTGSFASGSGQWLRVGTLNNFIPLAAPDAPLLGVGDPEGLDPPPVILPPPAALPVVPGLANVTLRNSTVIGSAFTAPGSVSSVTLLDNSTWIMTGSSNVTNLVNDPSLIQFTPPTGDANLLSSYKTLTTVNYVGINGIIGLNTYLGNDSAPSDRLVIDGGTATGLSPLRIANTIGRGDLTRGNGILVIDAVNGGTTAPGTFVLAGPVSAGPYDYTLHRSSIVDASNPDDWYLRSRINCALEPTNPACAQPSPDPANYRPETSLYAAIPSMALLYGRSLLDTLHERVGEEEDQRNRPNPENGKVGWARIIGVTGHQNGDRLGIFGSGPQYSYSFGGLQGGMDVYRHDKPDGSRDQAGVYFAIGNDRGRVTHISGVQGNSNFDAYSLGGYWTHFGPQGWYTDTILQGTFYDVDSSAHRGLATLNTNGQGLAASVEAGHPFRFADGYFIEPQVQMIYQSIAFANASDGAALVRFDNADSLLGRIGARFGRTWSIDGGPRSVTAWIRPNLWNEFRGNPVTSFSSEAGFIPFRADLGGLFGELNIGASGQLSADVTLYANASYQARFDGAGSAYDGKVGMRFAW